MKNEILFTLLTEDIQRNLSDGISRRVAFLEQSIDSFRNRFADLTGNKAVKGADVWKRLSEILTNLYQRLNESFELESMLGHASFTEQWRDPYLSRLEESEADASESYDDGFWRLKSSATLTEKRKKVVHYLQHPVAFLNAHGRFPGNVARPQRTFSPRLFNEAFVLLPVFDFQWQELRQLLLFYSEFLIRLQNASHKLKDNILLTGDMQSPEQYWMSVHDLRPDKFTAGFASGLEEVKQAIGEYEQAARMRLAVFLEDLAKDYGSSWRYAGSAVLPRRAFAPQKMARAWLTRERRTKIFRDGWVSHLESVKDEWQKDLELGVLQLKIAILHFETGTLIENKSRAKILPALQQLMQRLSIARKELDTFLNIPEKELIEKLLVFSRTLQRGIRQKELANAVEILTNAHISRTFRGFVARVKDLAEDLAERHVIIKAYNLDKSPPRTTLDEVMLKDIVMEEIVVRAEKASEQQIAQVAVNLDAITRTVATLDQVIEFNFTAAIDLVRQGGAETKNAQAIQIITEGIDRTLGLLHDSQERYNTTIADGRKRVDALAFDIEQGVQELGDNEKILQLKLRLARARTRENLRTWRSGIWHAAIKFMPNVLRIVRGYFSHLSTGYRKVRKISGLGAEVIRQDISQYLREEEQKITKLPFIYQRLFEILPLEEERFFFGRDLEMGKIKEQFEGFKNGQIQIAAVIGEKGGGKTTLLNFACRSVFKGYPISRQAVPFTIWKIPEFADFMKSQLHLECAGSIEAIERELKNGPRRILILEDIHNLFLRTIDGFDVIEALLKLISATQEQIYWVLTSGLYGWKFLDYFTRISDFFTEVIELDNLDPDEVEQLIMSRHNMSGFRLEFIAGDPTAGSRSYRKLKTEDDRQQYLYRRFFEHLSEISGGNVKTSMMYWISSVNFSKPDEPIRIIDNLEIDQSFIYKIQAEDLYYLAAYVQHEYLTVSEFAAVFRIEPAEAKFIMDRLTRMGYLKLEKDNYLIPSMLYRPIVQVLKIKNIIY